FKPQAYEKAAINLEVLPNDVNNIYEKEGIDGLRKIPGIGQHIADKIVEYIKTGKIKAYSELKKKIPVDIDELAAVEGVGPKKIKELYELLKIKNLKDLEKAAKSGKIRALPRFGLKTEQNILESIGFLKRSRGRFLLGEILPAVREIIDNLKNLKEVKQISEAGSVRRRKETIGDVDILITSSNPAKVVNYFTSMSDVIKIWGKGPTKASVRLKDGFDVDLRVLPENQFGSALQYFTGSKEHNIALRKIAIDKGYKLSEYGLFRGVKLIASKTEEEIYQKLGLRYIEPELRENTGEIEAAIRQVQGKPGELPKLINYGDLLGDLQIQSDWTDGKDSIEELAKAAIKKGLKYAANAIF
ncbi:DNA polymerase III, partial [Candidatus Wolfebacteria bacterium]|nr:DNA polymerase III [Candidatus Wolfebacteria bacterium]